MDYLLLPENKDELAGILKYHVVAANALSSTLTNTDLPTLEDGETVVIGVSPEGDVKVNDASVIIADIISSNGIVHVIDQVLLPPDDDASADSIYGITNTTADFSTLGKIDFSLE